MRMKMFAILMVMMAAVRPVVAQPGMSRGSFTRPRESLLRDLLDHMPIDSPMNEMIAIEPAQEIVRIHPRAMKVWSESLDRPDMQTRQLAMIEILRAHQQGMKDLDVRVGTKLMALLEAPDQKLALRLMAAQTLVEIDARQAAPSLLTRNACDGRDMVLLTDPALARWGYAPSIHLWISRLDDPLVDRTSLVSAVRSLATCRDPAAAEPLTRLVLDRGNDDALRLACARALSEIQETDLEALAEAIMGVPDATTIDRLVGVELLARCTGDRHVEMLQALAEGSDIAARQLAVRRMGERTPTLLLPYVDKLIRSEDSRERRLAVEALGQSRDEASIAKLASMLRDPTHVVRAQVRDHLFIAAEDPTLGVNVRSSLMKLIASTPPNNPSIGRIAPVRSSRSMVDAIGAAEAMLMLGKLKHGPAAQDMVRLMSSSSPLERVSAVVAMRYLGDPSVLPAMEERAWELAVLIASGRGNSRELQQLFQTFGVMRYEPAVPLLLQYVPKDRAYLRVSLRESAVWALGAIYESNPHPEIVQKLVERIEDMGPQFNERQEVRNMAAVALGMMNATDQIELLERAGLASDYDSDIHLACQWAISRMKNEPMPRQQPRFRDYNGVNLEPFDR